MSVVKACGKFPHHSPFHHEECVSVEIAIGKMDVSTRRLSAKRRKW
jgi:hypothetical protein